jgi:hypothetical protein
VTPVKPASWDGDVGETRPLKRLAELEDWLGGRDYLEGRFTAGDLLMTTVLRILRHTDIVSGRPALKAYQDVNRHGIRTPFSGRDPGALLWGYKPFLLTHSAPPPEAQFCLGRITGGRNHGLLSSPRVASSLLRAAGGAKWLAYSSPDHRTAWV